MPKTRLETAQQDTSLSIQKKVNQSLREGEGETGSSLQTRTEKEIENPGRPTPD